MTIICAASRNGKVAIGCDSAATTGHWRQHEVGTKIRQIECGWVGFAGTFRTSQVVLYELQKVKKLTEEKLEEFVGTVQDALIKAGWNPSRCDGLPTCDSLNMLIASNEGRIYTLQSDLAMIPWEGYGVLGSGDPCWIVAEGIHAAHHAAHAQVPISLEAQAQVVRSGQQNRLL